MLDVLEKRQFLPPYSPPYEERFPSSCCCQGDGIIEKSGKCPGRKHFSDLQLFSGKKRGLNSFKNSPHSVATCPVIYSRGYVTWQNEQQPRNGSTPFKRFVHYWILAKPPFIRKLKRGAYLLSKLVGRQRSLRNALRITTTRLLSSHACTALSTLVGGRNDQ